MFKTPKINKAQSPASSQEAVVNYRQSKLMANIKKYYEIKAAKLKSQTRDYQLHTTQLTNLDFNNKEGLCSGLVAHWLYSMRTGQIADFEAKLKYGANWNPTTFANSNEQNDIPFEKFINNITFLHHYAQTLNQDDGEIISPALHRHEIHKGLGILADQDMPQVANPEYIINFVFDIKSLQNLLRTSISPNKMVRFENLFHVVGLFFDGNNYHFYDPNAYVGTEIFISIDDLATQIFTSLAQFNEHKKFIAINMSVFDLVDSENALRQSPQPMQFIHQYTVNPKFIATLVKDPNIFHLASQYQDFAMLDLLYQLGYKYKPWLNGNISDLNEAVFNKNPQQIKYLIAQGANLEFRSKDGETCLGSALRCKLFSMAYILLKLGANPNTPSIENGKTLLEDALVLCRYANTAYVNAIVLLLAFNAKLPNNFLPQMQYAVGAWYDRIISAAVNLSREILSPVPQLNLESASQEQIINFLKYYKLRLNLHYIDTSINVITNRKNYDGIAALMAIAQHYKFHASHAIADFKQQYQIYQLLKEFKNDDLEFTGSRELTKLLENISKDIRNTPIAEILQSTHKIIEISDLLKLLTEISNTRASFKLLKIKLSHNASIAKHKIEQYLSNNGVSIHKLLHSIDTTANIDISLEPILHNRIILGNFFGM